MEKLETSPEKTESSTSEVRAEHYIRPKLATHTSPLHQPKTKRRRRRQHTMAIRTKAASNSLTRIAQDSTPKLRDSTPSLRTETTAPCSDEEGSPGKQQLRVKVKVKKSAIDSGDRHRSLNATELEQVIRNLQKKERTEKRSPRTSSSSNNAHLKHASERFHQFFPGDLILENVNHEKIVPKSTNAQRSQKPRSRSSSRHRSTSSSRERSRERSTRTAHLLQDPPTTPCSTKSSHTRQSSREQNISPSREQKIPTVKKTPRSTTPKRLSTKGGAVHHLKIPTTPVRSMLHTESPNRMSSSIPSREAKERRSVSRTRSNNLEYFTPVDVAFPDPWVDVRKSPSSENCVNDLVLQSGIITAGQLKQLLNAGFTFNGPEFLDAFP